MKHLKPTAPYLANPYSRRCDDPQFLIVFVFVTNFQVSAMHVQQIVRVLLVFVCLRQNWLSQLQ